MQTQGDHEGTITAIQERDDGGLETTVVWKWKEVVGL